MGLFSKLKNLKEKICSSSAYSFALKYTNRNAYNQYLIAKVDGLSGQRVFDCNTGYVEISQPKYIPELGLVSTLEAIATVTEI